MSLCRSTLCFLCSNYWNIIEGVAILDNQVIPKTWIEKICERRRKNEHSLETRQKLTEALGMVRIL